MESQTSLEQAPAPAPQHSPSHLVKMVVGGLIIAVIFYAVGLNMGRKGFVYQPKSFSIVNQKDLPQKVDYQLLWEAEKDLNDNYINKPLDPQTMLYGAIRGVVASAGDPYTTFFEPKELQNFQTTLKGSFAGIGAEVGSQNGFIVIIAPLDGTPAQKAGLMAQDIIASVNGASTATSTVDQVVDLIRGEKGTNVTLTIVRKGKDKPFDVTIKRDIIQVKSVKWSYKDVPVNGKNKHIADITINQFGDDTVDLFNKAVDDALKNNVDGIVLDLRNNPGGYLQAAVEVASNWVKSGDTVVTEAHSNGTSQKYAAEGNPRLANIKTVVLINGGSASAAEILSGALHDYKIARLIGDKSFGKGSVQELVNLSDGSAIKITIAKWITPNGQNLNHNGLDPDVAVTLSQENVDKGLDPQMDKALEEVTK